MKLKLRRNKKIAMDMGAVQVSLPKSWHILTATQAHIVGKFLSGNLQSWAARTAAFLALAGIEILATSADGSTFLCRLKKGDRRFFQISADEARDFSTEIEWMFEAPKTPWRPPLSNYLSNHTRPWQPDFSDMNFGTFLEYDSLLQGYLIAGRSDLMAQLAVKLYAPTSRRAARMLSAPWATTLALEWMLSVKNYIYSRFDSLFSSSEGSTPDPKAVRRAVDVQIRALTKGDATKEEDVLHLNLYRALTELDAQAREAIVLKAKMKNG